MCCAWLQNTPTNNTHGRWTHAACVRVLRSCIPELLKPGILRFPRKPCTCCSAGLFSLGFRRGASHIASVFGWCVCWLGKWRTKDDSVLSGTMHQERWTVPNSRGCKHVHSAAYAGVWQARLTKHFFSVSSALEYCGGVE